MRHWKSPPGLHGGGRTLTEGKAHHNQSLPGVDGQITDVDGKKTQTFDSLKQLYSLRPIHNTLSGYQNMSSNSSLETRTHVRKKKKKNSK